jgi:hypothetical protein
MNGGFTFEHSERVYAKGQHRVRFKTTLNRAKHANNHTAGAKNRWNSASTAPLCKFNHSNEQQNIIENVMETFGSADFDKKSAARRHTTTLEHATSADESVATSGASYEHGGIGGVTAYMRMVFIQSCGHSRCGNPCHYKNPSYLWPHPLRMHITLCPI